MTRPAPLPRQAGQPPRRHSAGTVALLLTAVSLAALSVTLLLLPDPAFARLYGQTVYPALSGLLSMLTSWTILPLGLAVLPLLSGIFIWRTLASGGRFPLTFRLLRPLLLAVALLALYLVAWGANYRRPPLPQLLGVTPREAAQQEIDALAGDLLAWVRATAAEMAADPGGADADAALAAVSLELERLALEVGWPARLPARVKLLPAGVLLRSGYAGMLFPFTLEPQVDSGLSHVSRVAVGAHELAHAAGFADEADADLAALLAGLRSPHPFARYACALSLLSRTLASLSLEQRAFVLSNLPPRALSDLSDARQRSARYLRPGLAARITAVYNRILRGQGVEAGVEAYGLAPRLAALIAAAGLLPPAPPPVPDGGVDEGKRPALANAAVSVGVAAQPVDTRDRKALPRLRRKSASGSGSRPMKSRNC